MAEFTPFAIVAKKIYGDRGNYVSPPQNTAAYKLLSSSYQNALKMYPSLANYNFDYKVSADKPENYYLETWSPNDPGGPGYTRPADLALDKPVVEIMKQNALPEDIMGDIVSHQLVKTSEPYKTAYNSFVKSLEPWQWDILNKQYKHETELKQNPETRPFEQWLEMSGLPSYFRGYLFNQWESPDYYTKDQLKSFDDLNKYMKSKK
jgi:hypothetical protein